MIIRLTLALAAGLAGSMMIFGTNQPGLTQDTIVATELPATPKPVQSAPAAPESPVVAATRPDSAAPATAPKPNPTPAPVAAARPAVDVQIQIAQVPDRTTPQVTRNNAVDLTGLAAATDATPPGPVQTILFVTGSRVNLRAGPSTREPVVGKLSRGAEAVLLSELDGGWLQIRDLESGTEGFMAGQFLSADFPG